MMQSVKRPKKASALTKHRKWLTDLQKTKDELEQKYIDDMIKKQEAQDKVLPYALFHGVVHSNVRDP